MQHCIIILRIVFDSRNFLWAGLTASSCLTEMCPGAAAGILLAEEPGLVRLSLGKGRLVSSHNNVCDFSGQSCPSQTRVCLPSSSPSPTAAACVSLLLFSSLLSPPITSSHLSTHFTQRGRAPPEKAIRVPTISQGHSSQTGAASLPSLSSRYHYGGSGFAVAMQDAIWSLQSRTCLRHKQSLTCWNCMAQQMLQEKTKGKR